MSDDKKGLWVNIGGTPVDLNAGMIEAVTNPPQGFVSKHLFVETDVAARVKSINWFARCGEPLALDLTMETEQARGWAQAIESCKAPAWENAQLEAQNQLTLWLQLHDRANYQRWNEIVGAHKDATVNPLTEKKILAPFRTGSVGSGQGGGGTTDGRCAPHLGTAWWDGSCRAVSLL